MSICWPIIIRSRLTFAKSSHPPIICRELNQYSSKEFNEPMKTFHCSFLKWYDFYDWTWDLDILFAPTCLDAFAWIQEYTYTAIHVYIYGNTRIRIRSYAPLLTRQRSEHPPLITAVFFLSIHFKLSGIFRCPADLWLELFRQWIMMSVEKREWF